MVLPVNNFLITWWYTPTTKLGIYFNDFGLNASNTALTSSIQGGVDANNGMAASIEENYHFENLITNHPVENSPAISDHIIAQPRIITVTGIITSIKAVALLGTLSFNQLGEATQLLIQLYESNQGISLTTGLLYGSRYLRIDNLAVQSLEIPRNNQYGRTSLKFTMVLKQLIITSKNGTVTPSSFSQATAADGVDIT